MIHIDSGQSGGQGKARDVYWRAGAVEQADEDTHDGQCGGQSRRQVFNTEITEKDKATEGTERIIFKTSCDN
jgi:hypothetical protein